MSLRLPETVLAQYSITVNKLQDLKFGSMVAGDSKTILPSNGDAALFEISLTSTGDDKSAGHGNNNWQDITVKFNLPNSLSDRGHSLNITFGPNSGLWKQNNTNINGAKLFDPGQELQLKIHKNKNIYLWIGGSVNSSIDQWSGRYSNMITVSINSIDN